MRGRRRSPEAAAPPDLCSRARGNFPQQWGEIGQAELEHRHRQAQLLVAQGHGAITWAELFGER
jgi:hypothetical protein